MRFDTQVLTSEHELARIDAAWNRLRTETAKPELEQRREWLASEARSARGLMVVTLAQNGELQAIAPFLLKEWKLQCKVGYASVVSFPMLQARLCGTSLLAPADESLAEPLFEAIAQAKVPYHTVFIESLAVDSPLRRLIDESPVIRRHFTLYSPTPSAKHWLVRLPKTFAEYDAALGKKRRGQFKASERKLHGASPSKVTVQRVTSVADLPAYFEAVERLSKVSWQGRKLGHVVEADSSFAERMKEFAKQGWFRGYLLKNDSEVIAFVIGFQSDGTYHYLRIGYDPKWSSFSPGNVMLYRLIEDLCGHDRPDVIDLGGGDSQYKRVFGNESFEEQNIYLMRRSPYTRVARFTHGAFIKASAATRAGLQRTGLLERARKVLRKGGGASTTPTEDEAT
jgi:CelD/BcsL family acetyltransferase involved in cellulose biosynthesis